MKTTLNKIRAHGPCGDAARDAAWAAQSRRLREVCAECDAPEAKGEPT